MQMAQWSTVADDCDALQSVESQQFFSGARHALPELALGFAVGWRAVPRVHRPFIARRTKDVGPAQPFPCAEAQLAQVGPCLHVAGIPMRKCVRKDLTSP